MRAASYKVPLRVVSYKCLMRTTHVLGNKSKHTTKVKKQATSKNSVKHTSGSLRQLQVFPSILKALFIFTNAITYLLILFYLCNRIILIATISTPLPINSCYKLRTPITISDIINHMKFIHINPFNIHILSLSPKVKRKEAASLTTAYITTLLTNYFSVIYSLYSILE